MKNVTMILLSVIFSVNTLAATYDCTNTKEEHMYGDGPQIYLSFTTGGLLGNIIKDARFGYEQSDDSKFEETTCTEGEHEALCAPMNKESPVNQFILHSAFGAMAQFKGVQAVTFLDCKKR